jgi:hypothetical protein
VGVEVGADAQHDVAPGVLRPRRRDQRLGEPGALGVVAAQREHLLELVHHDQQIAR